MSKPFPVLWSYTTPERERTPKFIRWDALNEEWAGRNHGQTLARLAERGGLSPCEIVANIERRPWHSIALSSAREAIAPYAVPTDETSGLERRTTVGESDGR